MAYAPLFHLLRNAQRDFREYYSSEMKMVLIEHKLFFKLGKTSTLQNISHNFTIGDAIDDYLPRLEDEHHLDMPQRLREAAEGSIYEANYDCDSYNVEKRHSGR